MPLSDAARIPRATFRVQLHAKFTFSDLEQCLPYLRELGVSELYLSPLFTASPGSLHGYDVNDYHSVSPDLGGAEGFARLTDRARSLGFGVLADMVPNHMGIAGPRNPWWRDVLAGGRDSAYSTFFDIQWNPEAGRTDRVLVPMLEDHYGRVLAEGKLTVVFEREFFLAYRDVKMPLRPESQAQLFDEFARTAALHDEQRRAVGEMIAPLNLLRLT
jgi:(1->4)-alpha-D-glucan 1-alpha-D-glucosylmutase